MRKLLRNPSQAFVMNHSLCPAVGAHLFHRVCQPEPLRPAERCQHRHAVQEAHDLLHLRCRHLAQDLAERAPVQDPHDGVAECREGGRPGGAVHEGQLAKVVPGALGHNALLNAMDVLGDLNGWGIGGEVGGGLGVIVYTPSKRQI